MENSFHLRLHHLHPIEWLLLIAGTMVMFYLPYFYFVQADFDNASQIAATVSLIGGATLLMSAPVYSAHSRRKEKTPLSVLWIMATSAIWFVAWLMYALFFAG